MRKTYRVKRNQDFKAIFERGKSVANRQFVVYQLDRQAPHFRVGLSVSKKLGNAVVRNSIKRKIRHIVQTHASQLQQVDFVLIARKGVENLDYRTLEKNLLHVLKLATIYQKGDECD